MLSSEFEYEMMRLGKAYGQPNRLMEREEIFWEFFKEESAEKFRKAILFVIGKNPYFPTVFDLKEALRSITPEEINRPPVFPDNPQAAELARKYAPSIRAMLKDFGKLPYDKTERIEEYSSLQRGR